ncbi:MAG: hypothetical protein HWE30_11210 [Methylocystaceae bacterium]|nr:hypothetical protein [Methylocystaceae bacterium]
MFYRKYNYFIIFGVILLLVSGCTKSYVDPTYGKTSYDDIERRADPFKWQIQVEFQRNGEPYPQANELVYAQVERIVRASGLAVPVERANKATLKIILNNVVDLGEAAAKGFGTGLTFGLAGSTVTDYYEMDVTLTDGDMVIKKPKYKHAIHSTVGNASAPIGLSPVPVNEAFSIVLEEMVLNALKDLEIELKEQMPRD